MARGEEITTKFKVDISDLKKGISDANKNIKLANAQFKAASAGMDDWGNSANGLKAKLTQLKSVLTEQSNKLKNYKEQLQRLEDAEQENKKRVEEARKAYQKAVEQYGENSDEAKKYKKALNEVEKEQLANENAADKLRITILNQTAAVKNTSADYKKYSQQLDEVEKESKQAENATENLAKEVKNSDDAVEKASDGFTVMKGALANLIADGINRAIDGIKSLVGEALDAADAMSKFEQTMGFAGYDKKTIKQASKDVKEYADRTVYDLSDISNTTAQLAANGIKDFTGLTQAAGNLNAVAGGNADTFKSVAMMLTQTAGAGKLTTENWNQLADAIPGASGILQDALKKNGAYTGNFRDAMSEGEITAEEFNKAIMEVGNKPVAVEAAKSVKTFEGAVGNLQATVVSALMDIINSIGMENITGFINGVSNGISKAMPYIKSFFNFFVTQGPIIVSVLSGIVAGFVAFQAAMIITKIIGAFQIFVTVLQASGSAMAALNAITGLNPFGAIAIAIIALVTALITLWNTSDTFRNTVLKIWESIKTGVMTVVNGIVSFLTTAWSSISKVVSTVWNGIKAVIVGVITVIAVIIGTYINIWKTVITTGLNIIKTVVTTVWNAIKTVTTTVWNAIKGVIMPIVNAIKTTITTVFNGIKKVITTVWNAIKTATSKAWSAIKAVVITPINAIKSTIQTVFNAIKSFIANTWGRIRSTTSSVWNGIKSAITSPMNAAKSAVSNIIKAIKGFFNFKISWPKIPLPHFSISPSGWKVGDLLKGSIPKLGIKWYAKGGVFDRGARILTGVGEDGAEAIVPLERNIKWIKKVAAQMYDQLNFDKLKNSINDIVSKMDTSGSLNNLSGNMGNLNANNTQNVIFNQTINSPKAVDRLTLYRETNSLLFGAKVGLKNV